MDAVRNLIIRQLQLYPGMEPEDCLKLLFQSEMGGEHLIDDEAAFARAIEEEMALPGVITANPPAPEPIGEGLCRVHLGALYKGPAAQVLARLCRLAASRRRGDKRGLIEKLDVLRQMEVENLLPYPSGVIAARIGAYTAEGCPSLHHSARFRALYRPHYRIIAQDMALYLPVFTAIDGAMAQKPHLLCGIDGMSGAGKSALAELLAQVYGCGVVHCDDFFLQAFQRTAERLASPGGNIDYERLVPVAAQSAEDRPFSYQAYDCRRGLLCAWRQVPAGRLTLLEGVYALHPAVGAPCDLRVFLSVNARIQRERVRRRSGEALARRFEAEWIPMENRYFVTFGIRQSADVALDTSPLG